MNTFRVNRRLLWTTGILGAAFSAVTVSGMALGDDGFWGAFSVGGLLQTLLLLLLFTAVFGAALMGLYLLADRITGREPSSKKESLFSRITGNGFVVFLLLVACWVPVWLAFYPGTFMEDSLTQFYNYLDWMHSAHHPLLHTLLLGFCMMHGIDLHAEGYATYGIAIYSIVQMVLLAAMLAYACHWLRKRQAPLWARLVVTLLFALFPFYSLWSFSAQKDILFGGLSMLFVLELIDLWREGWPTLRSPWRIIRFVILAVLMMLMRNNGVYALVLLIPFAVLLAKGARWRVAALLVICVAAYFGANGALVNALEAESGSRVEMLSIPLQQIARTLRDHPDTPLSDEEQALLERLYPDGFVEYYEPAIADPVKWAIDYDELDESTPELLQLWARLLTQHPVTYVEAFMAQNLPYLLPFSEMLYRFDLGVVEIDLYPVDEYSYFPEMRQAYLQYDQTLSFLGIPGTKLLSDTAFQVWLCMAALGYCIWKRQTRFAGALCFLLAIWLTCLLGPVALMRYMLSFFYSIPVILAAMLQPKGGKAQ